MLTDLSAANIVVIFVSILISITLHEAMHGYAAYWLGDRTAAELGRLTLNPLKSIDLVTTIFLPLLLIISGYPPFFAAKPVPFDPSRVRHDEYGVALVGVAGPLTNLLLAAVGAGAFRLFGADPLSFWHTALLIFTEVNIAFFVFNLIPFPPLDGSRVLYAFAPEPLQRLMMQIESAGFLAILVFMLLLFRFIAGPIISIENAVLNALL